MLASGQQVADETLEIRVRRETRGRQQNLTSFVLDLQLFDESHIEDLHGNFGTRQCEFQARKHSLRHDQRSIGQGDALGDFRRIVDTSPSETPVTSAPTARISMIIVAAQGSTG